MKIPDKKVANSQAQELKRQQIQEGTEMVEKIEALRKALNSLQDQHKHFIATSKEEFDREILELRGQKESLKSEVESLTAVREELKRPLDAEWKVLKDNQIIFEREKEKFVVADEKLDARERELQNKEARLNITLERAEKAQIDAEKMNAEAQVAKEKAEYALKAMQENKQNADKEISKKMEELKAKEDSVEFEKKGVEHFRKLQDLKERELNDRERAINDKYQTLLRTQKRIKA